MYASVHITDETIITARNPQRTPSGSAFVCVGIDELGKGLDDLTLHFNVDRGGLDAFGNLVAKLNEAWSALIAEVDLAIPDGA